MGGREEGGLGWGIHVNPWLTHGNVWQKEKNLPVSAGDEGSIFGSVRSPGEGNGNLL